MAAATSGTSGMDETKVGGKKQHSMSYMFQAPEEHPAGKMALFLDKCGVTGATLTLEDVDTSAPSMVLSAVWQDKPVHARCTWDDVENALHNGTLALTQAGFLKTVVVLDDTISDPTEATVQAVMQFVLWQYATLLVEDRPLGGFMPDDVDA